MFRLLQYSSKVLSHFWRGVAEAKRERIKHRGEARQMRARFTLTWKQPHDVAKRPLRQIPTCKTFLELRLAGAKKENLEAAGKWLNPGSDSSGETLS